MKTQVIQKSYLQKIDVSTQQEDETDEELPKISVIPSSSSEQKKQSLLILRANILDNYFPMAREFTWFFIVW